MPDGPSGKGWGSCVRISGLSRQWTAPGEPIWQNLRVMRTHNPQVLTRLRRPTGQTQEPRQKMIVVRTLDLTFLPGWPQGRVTLSEILHCAYSQQRTFAKRACARPRRATARHTRKARRGWPQPRLVCALNRAASESTCACALSSSRQARSSSREPWLRLQAFPRQAWWLQPWPWEQS